MSDLVFSIGDLVQHNISNRKGRIRLIKARQDGSFDVQVDIDFDIPRWWNSSQVKKVDEK